jgi:hypothetical protein
MEGRAMKTEVAMLVISIRELGGWAEAFEPEAAQWIAEELVACAAKFDPPGCGGREKMIST